MDGEEPSPGCPLSAARARPRPGHRRKGPRRARGAPGGEIETVTGREKVEPWAGRRPCIVDERVRRPDDLEPVPAHHDPGILVQADAEQVRMLRQDLEHVELAVPAKDVLVDADAAQVPESALMVSDDDLVGARVAADQERSLDRRARGGP